MMGHEGSKANIQDNINREDSLRLDLIVNSFDDSMGKLPLLNLKSQRTKLKQHLPEINQEQQDQKADYKKNIDRMNFIWWQDGQFDKIMKEVEEEQEDGGIQMSVCDQNSQHGGSRASSLKNKNNMANECKMSSKAMSSTLSFRPK